MLMLRVKPVTFVSVSIQSLGTPRLIRSDEGSPSVRNNTGHCMILIILVVHYTLVLTSADKSSLNFPLKF